jgi:Mrp family chromosome partitioning ATPase
LAADLLGQRIPEILEYFAPDYDLIVVDGPPFLGIAESLRLASSVDTVVVVARAGRTKQASLELVLNLLAQLRANIAGIVLNQAPAAIGELYGNYRCG